MNTIPHLQSNRLANERVWRILTPEQKRQLAIERAAGTTPPAARSMSVRPVASAGAFSSLDARVDAACSGLIAAATRAAAKIKSSRVTHGAALSPKLRGMDLYKVATRKQLAKLSAPSTMGAADVSTKPSFTSYAEVNAHFAPLLEAARAENNFWAASRLNREWRDENRKIAVAK
jgi:hypothetical protein